MDLLPFMDPEPGTSTAPGEPGRARLRLGTSSWSESSWVGCFYPAGTQPAGFLAHYATRFDTVEADVTYYRCPERRLVAGWDSKTPAGFTLSAKFPRDVVHAGSERTPDGDKVLRVEAVGEVLERFLDSMRLLGSKLGPLVLQLPYFNRAVFADVDAFLKRLDAFLGALPAGPRYAVVVRNKAWIDAPLLEVLRRHRAALVLVDLVYMPHPADLAEKHDLVTADFVYARLIGDRKRIDALTKTFDAIVLDQGPRLARWAPLLRELGSGVKETFAYANNHYAGHGPATIEQLGALVRGDGGDGGSAPRAADGGSSGS